ncbi:hypothetical protein DFH09DRAFT_327788 [Mycena vulgaris]|nr:hypothetical protein DFH09DRAFT_327788 [Mycena vulgaris]
MRRYWAFLDMTSHGFSSVIKELEVDWYVSCSIPPPLNAHSFIMLDDMVPSTVKRPLLRNFHVHIRRESGANFAAWGGGGAASRCLRGR